MAITLPRLPFALDALEPYISRRTLEYHYGKHHRGYVDTLNKIIEGTAYDQYDLEEIMESACGKEPEIFNNAAQAWNHSFYWNCLSKKGDEVPSDALERLIDKKFGSLSTLQARFTEEAKSLFGSGWVWLVKDKRGVLRIRALSDAENPILDGETPILVCDVWEHAYYLDYQNDRAKYLKNFWSVVNWGFVESALDLNPARSWNDWRPVADSPRAFF